MIDLTGQIKDLTIDYDSRKPILSLVINEDPGDIRSLLASKLTIKIGKYRAKRSLDANGYYWVLLQHLSEEQSKEGIHTSVARLHNLFLRRMWPQLIKRVDGGFDLSLIKDTDEAENEVLDDINNHRMPIPADVYPGFDPVENNSGNKWRWYMGLNGSSTMDSKQFSTLLDIAIEECRQCGIPTETPEEIARMKALMEKKYGNKANRS